MQKHVMLPALTLAAEGEGNSAATARGEIFAANRASGLIGLSIGSAAGTSRRRRVHEAGSLRVRFPNGNTAGALDAVIVNTAGGMTGGDRFAIDIDVGAGARLTVATAAAEKIYRSLGPNTQIGVQIAVGSDATLAWLPQETILFDQARLRRTIDVDLAAGARLLMGEAIVFGRTAMGETVTQGCLFDRWRVRAGGALVFADAIRLDGAVARRLGETAVTAHGAAIANVLKIPGDDDSVAAMRAMQQDFIGEVGISTWSGLAAARLVAPDGAALRHDLVRVLTAWHGEKLPRIWLN